MTRTMKYKELSERYAKMDQKTLEGRRVCAELDKLWRAMTDEERKKVDPTYDTDGPEAA